MTLGYLTEDGITKLVNTIIYGSSRIGVHQTNTLLRSRFANVEISITLEDVEYTSLYRGKRHYELSNHLGNVQVVVSDKRISVCDKYLAVEHFEVEVLSAVGYYPFGMMMPDRKWYAGSDSGLYSFGFGGQEKDDEVSGVGNSVSYRYRIHDTRLGRFLSVDPLAASYPWNSPYAFAENRVIDGRDLEGLEFINSTGAGIFTMSYEQITKTTIDLVIIINVKKVKACHSYFQNVNDDITATYLLGLLNVPVPVGPDDNKSSTGAHLMTGSKNSGWRISNFKAGKAANALGALLEIYIMGDNFILTDKEKATSEIRTQMVAMNSAFNLVNKAMNTKGLIPEYLITECGNQLYVDITNYVFDGTLPSNLGASTNYIDLVQSLGNIIFTNNSSIMDGTYSPIVCEAVVHKVPNSASDPNGGRTVVLGVNQYNKVEKEIGDKVEAFKAENEARKKNLQEVIK